MSFGVLATCVPAVFNVPTVICAFLWGHCVANQCFELLNLIEG